MCFAKDCVPFPSDKRHYGWIHSFLIVFLECGMGVRSIQQLKPYFAHRHLTIPKFNNDIVIYDLAAQTYGCVTYINVLLKNGLGEHHGIIMAQLRLTDRGPKCVALKVYQGLADKHSRSRRAHQQRLAQNQLQPNQDGIYGNHHPHTDVHVLSPVRIRKRKSNLPDHLKKRAITQLAS